MWILICKLHHKFLQSIANCHHQIARILGNGEMQGSPKNIRVLIVMKGFLCNRSTKQGRNLERGVVKTSLILGLALFGAWQMLLILFAISLLVFGLVRRVFRARAGIFHQYIVIVLGGYHCRVFSGKDWMAGFWLLVSVAVASCCVVYMLMMTTDKLQQC